jgi:hypothetical protein
MTTPKPTSWVPLVAALLLFALLILGTVGAAVFGPSDPEDGRPTPTPTPSVR